MHIAGKTECLSCRLGACGNRPCQDRRRLNVGKAHLAGQKLPNLVANGLGIQQNSVHVKNQRLDVLFHADIIPISARPVKRVFFQKKTPFKRRAPLYQPLARLVLNAVKHYSCKVNVRRPIQE